MLRLHLLGTPLIRADDRPLSLPSHKAQALLFYLAAEAERRVSRGQMIALLWEESSEKEGRNSLSTVLSRLRSALPLVPIRSDGDTLAWDPSLPADVDLHHFQEFTRPNADDQAFVMRLESALALHRGPFLDGFEVRDSATFDEWLRLERERWHYRILNTLDLLVECYGSGGNFSRAMLHARAAIAIDPLQERFHRALMRFAALSGDRAAALAQFRMCRELLERELGVEPDPETIALDAEIRAGTLVNQGRPARPGVASVSVAAPHGPATQSARLGARLESARRHSFVGRQAELQLFGEALAHSPAPCTVLHLYGPGGVGKTTLLAAFARHAAQAGVAILSIDGRSVEPTPAGVMAAIQEQFHSEWLKDGSSSLQPPFTVHDLDLDRLPDQVVVLVDTYEMLMPIESWLRDSLLPHLPERALVVLAGRAPPSSAWRADPGWQAISRTVRLGDLSVEDATEYLRRRAVPETQHAAVLRATRGFPLGLSLASEVLLQRPNDRFEGLETPDLVQTLLERFLDRVPSIAHRAALEAASQVRTIDEPLLAAMLAHDEARELFDWLQGLSFVLRGRRGIFLHDLARETLAADLRWRNPPWYRELHDRARAFYSAVLAQGDRLGQQQALLDLIFLHDNPLIRSLFVWNDVGGLVEDTGRTSDWPALAAMVARYEGAESAGLAQAWFERQPGGVTVFRDEYGQPAGFSFFVALEGDRPDVDDPCAAAVMRFMQRQPPLASDQFVAIARFWMDRDAYQNISVTQTLIFVAAVRYVLTTPGLAASFHVFAEPDAWVVPGQQLGFERVPDVDFEVGGRQYGVFCRNWRAVSPQAWLAALAEHETRA